MTRILSRLSPALLVVLAGVGVWLIVAPFAVGYQPRGASWVPATHGDVIAGSVLLGVSLITLGGVVALALRARMRRPAATTSR
ncbi:MAG: hypothetical protein ACRDN9_04840 [Streptosporangiaceae bacterium]